MAGKFDFDAALKAVQSGQSITGKDGEEHREIVPERLSRSWGLRTSKRALQFQR